MSQMRALLFDQLTRFDDDAFAALANRGLLRRARKDLETQAAAIVEEGAQHLLMAFGQHKIRFDARGPAHAQCTCPSAGVCQHILAAALSLQAMAHAQPAAASAAAPDAVALASLAAALMALSPEQLLRHAGRAGYRWAWQLVHDLDLERDVSIGGERHIVIGFRHPRVTLRYMGGGIDSLVADVASTQLARQQLAAVLAYRRAHGVEDGAPEEKEARKSGALALGKDHALAEPALDSQEQSRARLRASAMTLFEDCIELGLAHLSASVHERFSTLAVWAQGAEYYRLALQLRRIADHVASLLERAGDADEQRLFDEITLACGLAGALGAAGAGSHLVGRARSRYDDIGSIELLGLGAHAWRTPSGFVGLTMLFWSPRDRQFYSWSDARPELMRGFHPAARYTAPGPWSGLHSPAAATGRLLRLARAQANEQGRLSGADSVFASVEQCAGFAGLLAPCTAWSKIARGQPARSLLEEAQPLRDWVVVAPARCGQARFDANRQVLTWPLFDADDARLDIELAYSDYTDHAIRRIEQLAADGLVPGDLLVVRIQRRGEGMLAEPLSLIRSRPDPGEEPVDALYFDGAPAAGAMARLPDRFGGGVTPDAFPGDVVPRSRALDGALWDFKQWLRRQAERGVPRERQGPLRAELAGHADRLAACGFSALARQAPAQRPLAGWLIEAHYVCLQYEKLLNDL